MPDPNLKLVDINQNNKDKRERMIVEAFNQEEGTVEDNSLKEQKLNDPKNILDRHPTRRQYNRGYRTKKEKDGSVTIKGRRGEKKN